MCPLLLHILRIWLHTLSWFSDFSTTSWGFSLLRSAKAATTCPSAPQIPRLSCCSPFVFLQVDAFFKKKKSPFWGWGEEAKVLCSICHLYLEVSANVFKKKSDYGCGSGTLETFIPFNSTSRLLGIYPQEITRNLDRSSYFGVHCSAIYKAKKKLKTN